MFGDGECGWYGCDDVGSFFLSCVSELSIGWASVISVRDDDLFDGEFVDCLGESLDMVDVWV